MKAKNIFYILLPALALTSCENNFPEEIGSSTTISNLKVTVRDSTNVCSIVDITVDIDTKTFDCFDSETMSARDRMDFGAVRIEGVYLLKINNYNGDARQILKYQSDGKLHASYAVSRDWSENTEATISYIYTSAQREVDSTPLDDDRVKVTIPACVWYTSGAVDMGVSVKWSATNLGASYPWQDGGYYMFGTLTPSTNSSYFTIENYKGPGNTKGDIAGNPAYDAARASLGAPWRMPTAEEANELLRNCKLIKGRWGGVAGTILESKTTGNFLFFPYSGYYTSWGGFTGGSWNYYWTSTPHSNTSAKDFGFYTNSDSYIEICDSFYLGIPIRPVAN